MRPDETRLNLLTQEGDPGAAEELLRRATRTGDRQGQIDAAFGVLVDASDSSDHLRTRKAFETLRALEAHEEAFCWFPDEVSRLEGIALCGHCGGIEHHSHTCPECQDNKFLPNDDAGEVADLLVEFIPHIKDKRGLYLLYLRCLTIWWPERWTDYFRDKGPYQLRSSVQEFYQASMWNNVSTIKDLEVPDYTWLPDPGRCICNGRGGCTFCQGRCPGCGNISWDEFLRLTPRQHRNSYDEYGCVGSRDGYCCGGSCDYCHESSRCPRCGKARGE